MDTSSVGTLELTDQTPVLLGSTAMATSLTNVGNSFSGAANPLVSRSSKFQNSSVEDDDDVVFIEPVQPPPSSAPLVADQRTITFTSSKNEELQGNDPKILPSSKELTSQKGSVSETIVIDDEEDMETNQGQEKNSSHFIERRPSESKNRTNDVDFSTSTFSRSKVNTGMGNSGITTEPDSEIQIANVTTLETGISSVSDGQLESTDGRDMNLMITHVTSLHNTNLGDVSNGLQSSNFGVNIQTYTPSLTSQTKSGVGPFNPGRMNVAGDVFQNGESAPHHNPDSWISQSASFPRNQKQQGVDSLSPVASLPKQIFQPSNQHLTKPVKITCANCKNPLQKGQTAYQRKGSAHLFCSTTCLSSFSHRRTRKTRNVACKKDSPMKTATVIPPVESSKSSSEFYTASLSPCEYYQDLRKDAFTKSRCIMCNKLGEVRHEISINSVTHKLCSNNCFNEYRLTNGLIMNCCEQCGKYIPKNTGHKVLITGQQKSFCCQSCASEYKEIMETKLKISLLQNRKRNAVREENERRLYESSTLSEKIGEIPEKKEKISEVIEVAAESSLDTSRESHVNSAPVTAVPDTVQEHLGDGSSDSGTSGVLSSDPGSWPRILNMKQRDSLVKNDPPQIRNFHFPKDNTGRKFSEAYYTRILPSGEKACRSWLLYSASKDAVFCLYCRLFGEGKNQLRNENGCRDWQHLSHILSKHEESEMHVNNSVKYSKLKSNLESKTDDGTDHRLNEDGENGVLLLYT